MFDVHSGNARVTVTDIDMPFWSMVRFMIKWAVATIPAMIILVVVSVVFGAIAMTFLGVLGASLGSLAK